ncbi:ABC transporter permease [Propionibacteriaceae bacterium G1746]
MTWVIDNLDVIGQLLVAHLYLALPPILASLVLAIPIAWLATKVRWLRVPIVGGASLMYAIPSLPLFIVLPLVLGTGIRDPINAIVALTLYGLALMVPATVDALRQVNPQVVDAAVAVGHPPLRRFLTVELPLAGPVMLSGLRVVAVSTISLVTVASVLGLQSLGSLFVDGFQRGITEEIITGLVVTAALALLVDWLLGRAGRLVLPWTRANAGQQAAPQTAQPSGGQA